MDNTHLSLAERRPRRQNRLLPARFRDIIPESLPFLHPTPSDQPPLPPSTSTVSAIPASAPAGSLATRIRQIFRTPRNVFGLSRLYQEPPSHDPEEHVDLNDLFDCSATAGNASRQHGENLFHPYPNRNSFLLGDWNWNHGIQKSRECFKELLNIVGSPDFNPHDVRHTDWTKIDSKLAGNNFDTQSSVGNSDWIDEDDGWNKTPISISVPFHSRAKNSGVQNYFIGDLYHRNLVSVIREKLKNPDDSRHFHYEPFELLWRPTVSSDDVRVHGELYTSPAFLKAHQALQDSPREPGCDLPRVVVAMMFSSDATHLTSFGTTKLWPGYLYFGNESKYHRCRPSRHLCNHIAYFLAVCCLPL
jgi:hypothetical protein